MTKDAKRTTTGHPTIPAGPDEREWTVRVVYREPTYEAQRGLPPTEYRASFSVRANGESHARERGLTAFRDAVRLEGVGWSRDVVRVDVTAVLDAG